MVKFYLTLVLTASLYSLADAADATKLRPPSVPLVACDPYFSIWSPADNLTDADTVHWTGKPHRLTALIRIDGNTFRLMGKEPAEIPALPQTALEVLPTRTIYMFEGKNLQLTLTFMTAALPDDLMIYSRPVTYVSCEARSLDEKKHELALYFEAAAEIAVNRPEQQVSSVVEKMARLHVARIGSTEQPILKKKGDDLRIDWGYLLLAAKDDKNVKVATGPSPSLRNSFVKEADFPSAEAINSGIANASDKAAALRQTLSVGKSATSFLPILLAYDDEYSIQYFKKNLRPFWRRNGDDAAALLKKAFAEYDSLKKRCELFDSSLMAALTQAGGPKYASLCALAYRECYAANKVVADANGQPLMFPKENFSNGCIGTVDVIYPMAPQFLLFSPSLTKAMLVPILDYAASSRWRWPFAPHDLGTYPLANGQVYGGGERTERDQMPVEETGNMLLMLAALAQLEGNADFCKPYWTILDKWADYLKAKGFDPENQLCTDDFAGHLAHNVNLSAKAICALGAYARLCEMRGEKEKANELMMLAKDFAARWVKEAVDGDHSRLAFDKPATWSQKYNLVWDRILGLKLFPDSVYQQEMAFYKTKLNQFGLPLDNRKEYTKLDWTLWTATLTENKADFQVMLDPVWRFINETPNRVPMTDWYWTQNAKQSGFQARSVVGGVFLQMLYDSKVWKEWASHDKTKAARWANLPTPPQIIPIVPTSESTGIDWRYTTQKPATEWFKPDFDTSDWQAGPGGFGTKGTPGAVVRTEWKTSDIWLRRNFDLTTKSSDHLKLRVHHDEDADIYIDGVSVSRLTGYSSDYDEVDLGKPALTLLKPGKHTLAVHCHQTAGGQYIDVGVVEVKEKE